MHTLYRQYLEKQEATAIAIKQKAVALFVDNQKNTIFHQKNTIRFSAVDHGRVNEAIDKLNSAELHLTQALAALQGFEGISKRELLLAANLNHAYLHMLNEFMHQNSVRNPQVKARHADVRRAVAV